MKFRNGFVSNSSSSSFIMGFKGKLSEKALMELFKTENKLLQGLVKEIVDVIVGSSTKTSIPEILNDYYVDTIDELPKPYRDLLKMSSEEGFNIYTGSFSDDGGESGMEVYLCHTKIYHKDDKIFFYSEGGY